MELGIIKEVNEINTVIRSLKDILSLNYITEFDPADYQVESFNSRFCSLESLHVGQEGHGMQLSQDIKVKAVYENDQNEEIRAPSKVVESKRKVCDILLFCLGIMNEHRVEDFLFEYKELVDKLEAEECTHLLKLSYEEESKYYLFDHRSIGMTNFNPAEEVNDKQLVLEKNSKENFFSKMETIIDHVNEKKHKLDMTRSDELIFVLINLMHYKDTNLRSSVTRLLFHLYNQTRTLGKTLSNLQIIDERRAKESFIRSRDYSYSLDTIGDTIEKWYQNEDSAEMSKLVNMLNKIFSSLFHSKTKREVDDFDISQFNLPQTDLLRPTRGQQVANFQGRKNKVSASQLNIKPQGNLTDVHQYMIDSFEEKIDCFEQDLIRNTGIIGSLLKMALFDVETEGKTRSNRSSVLIMKKIYRILAKACYDNEKNKEEVSQYMDSLILKHFQESTDDLNTVFLIREAIRNNKSILLSENKVTKISRILCWSIDETQRESIEKSYILLILSDMVKYNEFILTKNQTTVLSLVISKEFTNIRVQFDNHQELESELATKAKNKMLNKQLKMIESKKILIIPSEVCYVIAYINLLASCSEGRNTFSENICQNLINLE